MSIKKRVFLVRQKMEQGRPHVTGLQESHVEGSFWKNFFYNFGGWAATA
jgi:hypothetical protein